MLFDNDSKLKLMNFVSDHLLLLPWEYEVDEVKYDIYLKGFTIYLLIEGTHYRSLEECHISLTTRTNGHEMKTVKFVDPRSMTTERMCYRVAEGLVTDFLNALEKFNASLEFMPKHLNRPVWHIKPYEKYDILHDPIEDFAKVAEESIMSKIKEQLYYPIYPKNIADKESKTMFTYKKVIFNNPATIVIWEDGTKTVVKAMKGTPYNPAAGLAFCFMERALGDKTAMHRVLDKEIPAKEMIEKELNQLNAKLGTIEDSIAVTNAQKEILELLFKGEDN